MKEKIEKLENYLGWNYDFRFNDVLKYVEFKAQDSKEWVQLAEENRTKPALRMDLMKIGFTSVKGLLDDIIVNPEFSKPFNPFNHYFNTLPKWDGIDHIKQLCSYIEVAEESEWFELMLKKHLIWYFLKQGVTIIRHRQSYRFWVRE